MANRTTTEKGTKEREQALRASVRECTACDIPRIIAVYRSAFAEPPWNEYKKCSSCGSPYGLDESRCSTPNCKKCGSNLKLVDFWSESDILKDLGYAVSQPNPIALVSAGSSGVAGFTWGYTLPTDKFAFLVPYLGTKKASYMDEIAVEARMRMGGIGRALCEGYVERAGAQGNELVVLRTDRRNGASMGLFTGFGFRILEATDQKTSMGIGTAKGKPVQDPEYPERIYLGICLR